jgi:hypothetical protein
MAVRDKRSAVSCAEIATRSGLPPTEMTYAKLARKAAANAITWNI